MTFTVDVVLKGRAFAVTEKVTVAAGDPASWSEAVVRDVLVGILRAIDRVGNPDAGPDREVALRGFSWIVEPADGQVVIAVEIPMGAAIAGPFEVGQAALDRMISRVLGAASETDGRAPRVH
jgi:hypothetical protein